MTSILNHALADRQAGNPNLIVDGNFDYWFEGDSQTGAGYGSSTMWRISRGISTDAPTYTLSRQAFSLGQEDVPGGPANYARLDVTAAGATADDWVALNHRIEDVERVGEHTLSFYAKADVAGLGVGVELMQNFGSGGTASPSVQGLLAQKITLTTEWQKFTLPVDLPSISGKTLDGGDDFLDVMLFVDAGADYAARIGGLGRQTGVFDFARVKLEEGSVATEGGWRNKAEELALVNRYFFSSENENYISATGWSKPSDNASLYPVGNLPVTMRAVPAATALPSSSNNSSISVSAANENTISCLVSAGSLGAGNRVISNCGIYADARL